MTAFDVLAMIFVLPFGVLFLAGGLALSLSDDWQKRATADTGRHHQRA